MPGFEFLVEEGVSFGVHVLIVILGIIGTGVVAVGIVMLGCYVIFRIIN